MKIPDFPEAGVAASWIEGDVNHTLATTALESIQKVLLRKLKIWLILNGMVKNLLSSCSTNQEIGQTSQQYCSSAKLSPFSCSGFS